MTSESGFIKGTEDRRKKILEGKLTMLPFDGILPRLSKVIPGVIPGDYVLITGSSGAGKSRLTRFLFVKHPINMMNQYGVKVNILYNSTEETKEKIESTFVQSYIYKKYGMNLSFYEINHYSRSALADSAMVKVREGWDKLEQFIRPNMKLFHIHNPFGFYSEVRKHMAARGKLIQVRDDGVPIEVQVGTRFDYYEPNDDNEFNIIISDNVNNYSAESGKSHEATLRYFSEKYCRGIMGIKFGCIVINVQQQVGDKERVEGNVKSSTVTKKLYPDLGSLAHCSHIQRDVSVALGIFKPQKYLDIMPTYVGYRVEDDPSLTGLHILKTRESEPTIANILPVQHLPGDTFKELPKIDDNISFSTSKH